MGSYAQTVFVALVLILILLIYSYPPARDGIRDYFPGFTKSRDALFGSRREHYDTYFNHDFGAQEVYGYDNTPDATLRAKYEWKEKDDSTGMRVYDYVYENKVIADTYNDEYMNVDAYPAGYMKTDKWPATIFNGEVITLAQKNY